MKVPKMATRRVQDLNDYLDNLQDDLDAFAEGKESRLKNILSNLRVLVRNKDNNGEGLILEVAHLAGCEDKLFVNFAAKEGIPVTNPLSRARTVKFKDYLNEITFMAEGREHTVRDFIWNYASSDASHSDSGLWSELPLGEQFILFGHNPNIHQVLAIGRTVLSVGRVLIGLIPTI